MSEEDKEVAVVAPTEKGGGSRRDSVQRRAKKESVWAEVIDIGGETVYAFLQLGSGFHPFAFLLGVATAGFQLFAFWVFFLEAYRCGFLKSDDCSLPAGGILDWSAVDLTNESNATETFKELNEIQLTSSVTLLGISMGIIITLTFLLPDFIKGVVFLRKGYFLIGLVHILISLAAITCSVMYTTSTAFSDVSILTNVVVLLFVRFWFCFFQAGR